MKRFIKARKDFTTVELITAISLFLLVVVFMVAIFLFSFNQYSRNAELSRGKVIGDTISQWLNDELRYATKLEITASAHTNTHANALQVQDGHMGYWRTDSPGEVEYAYDTDFYQGMTVATESKVEEERWLTVKVLVYNSEGKQIYAQENTYEIVNLTLAREEGGELTKAALIEISGDLAHEKISRNAVFCFQRDTTVMRDDYILAPAGMYQQAKQALTAVSEEERNDRDVQAYVRQHYYGGQWPLATDYLNIERLSLPTDNPLYPSLAQRNINVQCYIAVENNLVLIYGWDYGIADPNIGASNAAKKKMVLVFVPEEYDNPAVIDMSVGQWYTYLPTVTQERWQPQFAPDLPKDESEYVAFFDKIKSTWHPVDGVK